MINIGDKLKSNYGIWEITGFSEDRYVFIKKLPNDDISKSTWVSMDTTASELGNYGYNLIIGGESRVIKLLNKVDETQS